MAINDVPAKRVVAWLLNSEAGRVPNDRDASREVRVVVEGIEAIIPANVIDLRSAKERNGNTARTK